MLSHSFLQKLYSDQNVFFPSSLTRFHHALRSPRNSERMNLEIGQIYYDIHVLFNKLDTIQTDLDSAMDDFFVGDPAVSYVFTDAATPHTVDIESIYSMLQRLERIESRLKNLSP